MNTVPNQRIITICKSKADKNHLYTVINLNSLNNALIKLQSIGGIKLFLYFASNQDKYEFALSRQDFMNITGCKETAYRTGFEELVSNGFLVEQRTKGRFTFYEWGNLNGDNSIPEEEDEKEENNKKPVFTF